MLTGNHYGNEISLIINSGVLAVIQSVMRQMGKYLGGFYINSGVLAVVQSLMRQMGKYLGGESFT